MINYREITYKLVVTKINKKGEIKTACAMIIDAKGGRDIERTYESMKNLDRIADIINSAKGEAAFILDVQIFAESWRDEGENLIITGRGINTVDKIELCPTGNKKYPLILSFSSWDKISGKTLAEALQQIRNRYKLC